MAAGFAGGDSDIAARGGLYWRLRRWGLREIIRNIIVTIPDLGAATGLSLNVYGTKPSPPDHIFDTFYISPWIFGAAA